MTFPMARIITAYDIFLVLNIKISISTITNILFAITWLQKKKKEFRTLKKIVQSFEMNFVTKKKKTPSHVFHDMNCKLLWRTWVVLSFIGSQLFLAARPNREFENALMRQHLKTYFERCNIWQQELIVGIIHKCNFSFKQFARDIEAFKIFCESKIWNSHYGK